MREASQATQAPETVDVECLFRRKQQRPSKSVTVKKSLKTLAANDLSQSVITLEGIYP